MMRRRRRTALAKSPTEWAIETLLALDVYDRYKLFGFVFNNYFNSGVPDSFYDPFYRLFDDQFKSNEEIMGVMYDEYDEPTDFGLSVADEAYMFIEGILADALGYDRNELTERL